MSIFIRVSTSNDRQQSLLRVTSYLQIDNEIRVCYTSTIQCIIIMNPLERGHTDRDILSNRHRVRDFIFYENAGYGDVVLPAITICIRI